MRLDALVAYRLGATRAQAQALVMEGRVRVGGAVVVKAGALVRADVGLEVEAGPKFVSRGGLKLERALDEFGWQVRGLRCLDVGASTGGFTDCLLQRGARRVTAIDVGYGQLAWQLRNDPRVTVIERTNFRLADPKELGAPFDFVGADVSFISLALLAPQFAAAVRGRIVALIKPQFEAGPAANKRGVVRDAATHVRAIRSVMDAFASNGLIPQRLTYSPVAGPAGNLEFLLGAENVVGPASRVPVDIGNVEGPASRVPVDIDAVVRDAHERVKRS